MTPRNVLVENVARAWVHAGAQLGIQVHAPYPIDETGEICALAYLPDFGSENGVLIDGISAPDFLGNPLVQQHAADHEIYYSAINLEKYKTYSEERFIEALKDWGFFGTGKPKWLS